MAVMAHPDDAEIWCGGTLILHAEKGDAVRVCTLSYTEDSVRGREGLEGAKRMGCEAEFLGLEDTAIQDNEEALARLVRSLESFQPSTLITHWPDDFHPDHEAVVRALRRAFIVYMTTVKPDYTAELPKIYYCDTYGSAGLRGPFKPDRFKDVSKVWDKKIRAMQAHQSQPIHYYQAMIERQCRAHGIAVGAKYAEGFIFIPAFGQTDNDEPL
jgi:LmbE family N-acetylglucosaminyl deacetylase